MFEVLRCEGERVSFACWPPVKCSGCGSMHGLAEYVMTASGSKVLCWQCLPERDA